MRRNAFTLVELLVVVSIIALLIAMLLPALNQARATAQTVRCASQLHQVMQGFHLYAAENQALLPHQRIDYVDWSGTINTMLNQPRVFACPVDRTVRRAELATFAIRSYANNSAKFTYLLNGYRSPWPADPTARPEKIDQVPSNVLLIGENHGHDAYPGSGWWADGGAIVGLAEFEGLDAYAWDLHHGEGINYGFADGRVEFLAKAHVDQWRADTDYGGAGNDPWKWK